MEVTAIEKAPWQQAGSEKRESVRRMFAAIAPSYDRVNGLMSLSRHRAWRQSCVRLLNLKPGDCALDICCGTGDFLLPLRQAVGATGKAIGADYCPPMLELAAQKLKTRTLALSDACALPFQGGVFDAATVGWGLRNLADYQKGIEEAFRVLKPGGRFLSLDMALPRSHVLRTVSKWVCGGVLPAIGKLFGNKEAYTYLPKSTESFASREELKAAFENAGFVDVRFKDLMLGNICIVWGLKP